MKCLMERRLYEIWDTTVFAAEGILNLDKEELEDFTNSINDEDLEIQLDLLVEIDNQEFIPKYCPNGLLPEIWQVLENSHEERDPHPMKMARVSLLCVILDIFSSFKFLNENHFGNCILTYGQANFQLGKCFANLFDSYGKGSVYENAKLAAMKKLEFDPKQKDKANVKSCWEIWRNDPKRYKSKSAFAKDMLSKYESLESVRVIERWCKSWEVEASEQSTD